MPDSPLMLPADEPVIDGYTLTVDEALNDPSSITRDIADLAILRFYMDKIMPDTALRKVRIEAGSDTLMELAAEAF